MINMSEHNEKQSKSKSYNRNYRQEETSRSRKRRKPGESKHCSMESRTPPLPSNSNSIEDLMKQRESLKEELNKIKHCDGDIKSKHRTSKDFSKQRYSNDITKVPVKRSRNCNNKVIVNKSIKEASPEHNYDDLHVESEDEETIIERRRKQRKKFLDNFGISQEIKCNDNNEIETENTKIHKGETKHEIINHIKSNVKEVNDMFSEKDDFVSCNAQNDNSKNDGDNNIALTDNWDDAEGYYNIKDGDVLNNNRYTIKSILGQGVFSNVVRAQDNIEGSLVAIKIVRNNELMYRTGLKEITFLKEIINSDPENKYHCVKFLTQFMHKGHLCIVLESLHMDLRCVIKKYGKHHGINMKALVSYSRQLLLALRLLKKIGIIHADIKPDNILVNEKKNILKLCDFGSATKVDDNEPTPYLVSRFYRAPEIILGIPYKYGVDIWSAACTIFEMATGKILFTGSSNNKMLKCFMDMKGKIPSRLLRRSKFKDQHFNYNNNFLLHKKDDFTGREKVVEVSNITIVRELYTELKKSSRHMTPSEEKKMGQLKDLLDRMIMLDANQRLSITDCLKHAFIQEERQN